MRTGAESPATIAKRLLRLRWVRNGSARVPSGSAGWLSALAAACWILAAAPAGAGLAEQCAWPPPGGPATHPASVQVEMAPIVADLDADGAPEIVVISFTDGFDDGPGWDGVLRILRGSDCAEIASNADPGCVTCFGEPACGSLDESGQEGVLCPGCGVAVGDLDGDGLLEIVAMSEGDDSPGRRRRFVVFDHLGAFVRCSERALEYVSPVAAPSLADINADGVPDVVGHGTAWSSAGNLLWSEPPHGIGMSTAADLDGDTLMEVITGEAVRDTDGTLLWSRDDLSIGSSAVADLDLDCVPEIILSSRTTQSVHVLDAFTGATRAVASIPEGDCPPRRDGQGGPPTLADTDGDCVPEIGVAGCRRYALFRYQAGPPEQLALLWEAPVDDASSRFTGSAIFDLDGDGTAEVVYNDHRVLRVFDALTGAVEQQIDNSTFTLIEFPVVADVDGDGDAEIVVAANNYVLGVNAGVRVMHDDAASFAPAPPLFNQHAYHVTNILPDGRIPVVEEPSWARYNTFRAQGPPLRSSAGPELVGVPADRDVACDEPLPPPATPTATAGCGDTPAIDFVEAPATSPCGVVTRTWTATDRCGRTDVEQQRLRIVDGVAPTVSVPSDMTLPCEAPLPPPSATASDACDPAPSLALSQVETPGPCAGARTVTRTWTATDACGNAAAATQVVTFVDAVAPALSGVPADVTLPCDAPLPPANPVATDACDPAPSLALSQVETPGPCAGSRTVTRTWTATDACGNAATATQVVTFVDGVAPVLSGVPGDVTATCEAPPAPLVSATDACDPAPTVSLVEQRFAGPCLDEFVVERTWTATDACGNVAVARQTVTVRDDGPPVIVGPPDVTVECDAVPPAEPLVATDGCDPAPVVTFAETRRDGRCPSEYDLIRTWTATDRCGNATTVTQRVRVVDTTPPVISGDERLCLWSPNHWTACFSPRDFHPEVRDACGGEVTWRFAGCASDQPEDALGDGAFAPDCFVSEDGSFCVRSERQGMVAAGRRYGVLAVATDACGNSSAPTLIGDIWVPRDQREHPDCLKIQDVGAKGHGRP